MTRSNERSPGVRRWRVWRLPPQVLIVVLVVETAAVLAIVAGVSGLPPVDTWWLTALVIGVLGIAHTEIAAVVERVRRRVTPELHVDLSSVWTFAAALTLPAGIAAGVSVLVFGHLWWRSWRPRVPPHRHCFSNAVVVLAVVTASATKYSLAAGMESGVALLGVTLMAVIAYNAVNYGLIAAVVTLSGSRSERRPGRPSLGDNLLEVAVLCLGAVVAIVLTVNPWFVVLVLPPLLVLHRAVLVRQLEDAAQTDGKTGLLNAAAWQQQARRRLQRRGDDVLGVLILDLDHFKSINDTYGHLAGDVVLASVAEALRSEVRDGDLIGRFGGEEFVVLLGTGKGSGPDEVTTLAERLRARVAALRVQVRTPDGPLTITGRTVSIGGARRAVFGGEVDALLQAADTALYRAKREGRNTVRIADRPGRAPSVTGHGS